MPAFRHKSVLLKETIDSLDVLPGGVYADCTAGGGGHSAEILSRLGGTGRLVCIDRDPDAVAVLKERFSANDNVTVVHGLFFEIRKIAQTVGADSFDGITADLGVSSFQLDNPDKGFSYKTDGPLRMTMGLNKITAYDIVNGYTFEQLRDIIFRYGEDKNASLIARAIVRAREQSPIDSTVRLAEIIASSVPAKARRDSHPARRTFQAIRIETNNEIEGLQCALDDMFGLLKPGGRLAIITFHSLEDKAVKHKFAEYCRAKELGPGDNIYSLTSEPEAKHILKGVTPSEEEISGNPRARSAKLRAIKKIR